MTSGFYYVPFLGLLVPVRLSFSLSVFVFAIKANVDSSAAGRDWHKYTGHVFLLTLGVTSSLLATMSLIVGLIRDEEKLPPRTRWECALFGLVLRSFLFGLSIFTMVEISLDFVSKVIRTKVFVGIIISLSTLLITLVVGMGFRFRSMRDANAAGEADVQKELIKNQTRISSMSSTMTFSYGHPSTLCQPPHTVDRSIHLSVPSRSKDTSDGATLVSSRSTSEEGSHKCDG
ncbi:hypothetical protein FRC14_008077 [Serendipita sp. 396]|nr:hypothetical protein FRC14_008077 [Serendipita sp. 396]KAG8780416.1 hypothetical protein FRC15_009563 [Serendipita sp. 397]KAG8861653.1 hypothetical protein FRC20_011447 [Serendipita sp. 405]